MNIKYLAALATTVGTMVGAGILALPYAISRAGFIYGLLLFLIVGSASLFITLYTGELSEKSEKMHQLPILVSRYAGIKLRTAILIFEVLTVYGVQVAYLVALGVILNYIFAIPYALSVVIVLLLASPLVYKGYKAVEDAEIPLVIIKLALIAIASAIILLSFKPSNIAFSDINKLFVPFGVILFSLGGYTVIPEIKEELGKNKRELTSVIVVSYLIAIGVYLLFSFAFIGAFGQNVAIIATDSVTSSSYVLIFYVTALFLLVTPYIALGLVLTDAFYYDFKVGRFKSTLISVFIPFVIAIVEPTFETLLSITGGIFLSILSLLLLFAVYRERSRKKEKGLYRVRGGNYLLFFTGFIMILGLVYTVSSFL
jgi:amino acid permease